MQTGRDRLIEISYDKREVELDIDLINIVNTGRSVFSGDPKQHWSSLTDFIDAAA
jgi:hypothetical protein